MSETSANELKALLGSIAKVVRTQVEETATLEDADGEVSTVYTASPALIGQAINLLKMNHISIPIEESDDLGALGEILAKKSLQGRTKLSTVSKIKEA